MTLPLITLYALVAEVSVGYCVTPSIVTKILSLVGGDFESVKSTVLPSPVKLSTLLSLISQV